jgi:hypothetical protein
MGFGLGERHLGFLAGSKRTGTAAWGGGSRVDAEYSISQSIPWQEVFFEKRESMLLIEENGA